MGDGVSDNSVFNTPTPQPTIKSPTPTPNKSYVKPTVSYTQPTQAPERKKVAVTLSNEVISGTFYCYEDKANLIMTTQNNLSMAHKVFDGCIANVQVETCNMSCEYDLIMCESAGWRDDEPTTCKLNCSTVNTSCKTDCLVLFTDCPAETADIQRLQDSLISQKTEYCP